MATVFCSVYSEDVFEGSIGILGSRGAWWFRPPLRMKNFRTKIVAQYYTNFCYYCFFPMNKVLYTIYTKI